MNNLPDKSVWLEQMTKNEPVARGQWRKGDGLDGWDSELSDANQFYTDLLADPDGVVSPPPTILDE